MNSENCDPIILDIQIQAIGRLPANSLLTVAMLLGFGVLEPPFWELVSRFFQSKGLIETSTDSSKVL